MFYFVGLSFHHARNSYFDSFYSSVASNNLSAFGAIEVTRVLYFEGECH